MIDAITDADLVIVPPTNPVVSVGTILGVPGVREALAATRAPVVGLSPIIGGTHVRGMAHQLLDRRSASRSAPAGGRPATTAPRADGGVLDGWLVDTATRAEVDRVREAGHRAARRSRC